MKTPSGIPNGAQRESLPPRTPRFRDPNKDYLELSYEELEARNLALREKVEKNDEKGMGNLETEIRDQLESEEGVKAVTVYWSDLNGKLHHTDFDKKHVLESGDNLTFDGSSISGFSTIDNSDLRFQVDWTSFRWAPSDVFGKGKVIVFANINNQDGTPFEGDFRQRLQNELKNLNEGEENIRVNAAPEVEGILLQGKNAEQQFAITGEKMEVASLGGYCDSLPQDELKKFIDALAEATRAMGFKNEKDHAEVAPGQFELAYKHQDALRAADQTLMYKLVARQIAANMGYTASFMPKPIEGLNGNGMHLNMSVEREGRNMFYDAEGPDQLSKQARMFIAGILDKSPEICLILNSSVNSFRRLNPDYEAPNEIKVSASDRTAIARVPAGNERSARVEIRNADSNTNPYLANLVLIRAGMKGVNAKEDEQERLAKLLGNEREIEVLPGTIYEAIAAFKESEFVEGVMGETTKAKYLGLKTEVAHRSPQALGRNIDRSEARFNHLVTNQALWDDF